MKKIWLVLILLPVFSFSQGDSVFVMGVFQNNSTVHLFGDRANIRQSPSLNDKNIVAVLPIGTPVTILANAQNMTTLNGLKNTWYKIQFQDKGQSKTGFVWGGLLSMASVKLAPDLLMLTGITSYKDGYQGEIRLVSKEKITQKVSYQPFSFDSDGFYNYSLIPKSLGSMGLTGTKNLVSLEFQYPACGYPNGFLYFPFDGAKLYAPLKTQSVSEGGVFHVLEVATFPSDHKQANKVIITLDESDFDEAKNDYVLKEQKITVYLFTRNTFKKEQELYTKKRPQEN